MAWYNQQTQPDETVISSRIRLARNIEGYPFPIRLSSEKANELINQCTTLFESKGFLKIDFSTISPLEASSYVEKHYVSPEFADRTGPHALFLNEPCNLAIMVCEEDHMRIQCIEPSLSLDQAFANISDIEKCIDEAFNLAFDEKLGYLTQCPTNIGTGMRASVMMFLPALTRGGYMDRISNELSKIGLTVRGMYGEGSKAHGSIYQISNQVCLGITEEDILKKLKNAVEKIKSVEKQAREKQFKAHEDALKDEIFRSWGVLTNAWVLSSSEFLKAYSDVHLGINLGLIDPKYLSQLNSLLIEIMPATITMTSADSLRSDVERDRARAALVRSRIAN